MNVKLILCREIRDQLRDRRTVFMIAVLPLLLYPLLGMSLFQVSQFIDEQATNVLMVGTPELNELPPLLDREQGNCFDRRLFADPKKSRLLHLEFFTGESGSSGHELNDKEKRAYARHAVQKGDCDAAVFFPANFAERARAYQEALRTWRRKAEVGKPNGQAPQLDLQPEIIYSTASEESQIAFARLFDVLGRWNERFGETNLTASGLPANAARPFDVTSTDVAGEAGRRGAALWSKVLPLILLLWAMTGAFYPAVDLCAGEKERGTLETLLSSPAERSEIVMGKLLTIMIFSMATAVLNLVSMGITGWMLQSVLRQFGPPPVMAALWLAIALVPVSALFSALCLALAAFARSTKEGQYYLVPLLLVTTPLVLLPAAPGVELNVGNSLIPVTGVVLLLRSMLEGNFAHDWVYALPVAGVTLGCCLLAIRWAIEQFNSESVLFRESERLDVGLWLRHVYEDRRPTPTAGAAMFCGMVILLVKFFMGLALPAPEGFRDLAVLALVSQLVVIATPTLLMTVMLTRSPRQTLLLHRPRWAALVAAAALAVLAQPVARVLQMAVSQLYPPSEVMVRFSNQMQQWVDLAPLWQVALVLAVAPALCEELAFRGFILSGFRHLGHKWRAIIYSALFFGLTHAFLQQSIVAAILGVLIGFVAVQTGSILPGMLFHVIHNTLTLASTEVTPEILDRWAVPGSFFYYHDQQGLAFTWPAVALSLFLAAALLAWFARLPHPISEEERRQQAMLKAVRM